MVMADKIAPGGTGEIKATLSTGRYKGGITKTVSVESNDPDNPRLYLKLKATVIPNYWKEGYTPPDISVQPEITSAPEIKFYFFYSKDCKDCEVVMKEVFSSLGREYKLHIRYFEIGEPDNYELLLKLEEKYKDTDNEIPVVVIGEHILGGKKEIQEGLEKIIQKYKQKGCDFPIVGALSTGSLQLKKIYLAYFYSKGCRECDRVSYELKYLQNKYPNLVIKRFDIDVLENKKLNEALCELYKVPEKERLVAPMLFIGEEFLAKKEISRKRINTLIEKYKLTGTKIPWEEAKWIQEKSGQNIKERFNTMGVLTVFSAGLIDGVNPCTFGALILFISFLSVIGKKGKELLLVGITFTSIVFITYFLIGLGVFSFFRNFEPASIIVRVIFSAVAVLAIIFGWLSIYDYFKLRQGKYEEAKLKLPKFLKKRIDTLIREKMEMKNTILAALVIGLVVSIGEFVCTGQVYLPTIMFVSGNPSLRTKWLTYLFLYNFTFIMPLLIVFTAAYKGTTSMALNLFWRKHVKLVKLATSVLFFVLAGLLIFYVYY